MGDSDVRRWLDASDEEVGPACMNVPVPPTIAIDERFREVYEQGYRHALTDVRASSRERHNVRMNNAMTFDEAIETLALLRGGTDAEVSTMTLVVRTHVNTEADAIAAVAFREKVSPFDTSPTRTAGELLGRQYHVSLGQYDGEGSTFGECAAQIIKQVAAASERQAARCEAEAATIRKSLRALEGALLHEGSKP